MTRREKYRKKKKNTFIRKTDSRTIVRIGRLDGADRFAFLMSKVQKTCSAFLVRVLSGGERERGQKRFLYFPSTWVGQDRSRYTLPGSPRHAAVTAVRFVETSVSGKRDWTTEGNVQEIKPARRLETKRRERTSNSSPVVVVRVVVVVVIYT